MRKCRTVCMRDIPTRREKWGATQILERKQSGLSLLRPPAHRLIQQGRQCATSSSHNVSPQWRGHRRGYSAVFSHLLYLQKMWWTDFFIWLMKLMRITNFLISNSVFIRLYIYVYVIRTYDLINTKCFRTAINHYFYYQSIFFSINGSLCAGWHVLIAQFVKPMAKKWPRIRK